MKLTVPESGLLRLLLLAAMAPQPVTARCAELGSGIDKAIAVR